jgi:transcriptional regulator with XRE-family HTH domain
MNNKEKFLKLVTQTDTETLKGLAYRVKNRDMLRESQRIALKVLSKLDELGWTQKKLAEAMQVSPQQITKIVSGKENLTIETQVKLQRILNISILAGFAEVTSQTDINNGSHNLYPEFKQFNVAVFAEEKGEYRIPERGQKVGEHIADLGEWIKTERKRQGLSAANLGLKAGISASEVNNIEKNSQESNLKNLSKVLHALNAKATLLVRSETESK